MFSCRDKFDRQAMYVDRVDKDLMINKLLVARVEEDCKFIFFRSKSNMRF